MDGDKGMLDHHCPNRFMCGSHHEVHADTKTPHGKQEQGLDIGGIWLGSTFSIAVLLLLRLWMSSNHDLEVCVFLSSITPAWKPVIYKSCDVIIHLVARHDRLEILRISWRGRLALLHSASSVCWLYAAIPYQSQPMQSLQFVSDMLRHALRR